MAASSGVPGGGGGLTPVQLRTLDTELGKLKEQEGPLKKEQIEPITPLFVALRKNPEMKESVKEFQKACKGISDRDIGKDQYMPTLIALSKKVNALAQRGADLDWELGEDGAGAAAAAATGVGAAGGTPEGLWKIQRAVVKAQTRSADLAWNELKRNVTKIVKDAIDTFQRNATPQQAAKDPGSYIPNTAIIDSAFDVTTIIIEAENSLRKLDSDKMGDWVKGKGNSLTLLTDLTTAAAAFQKNPNDTNKKGLNAACDALKTFWR